MPGLIDLAILGLFSIGYLTWELLVAWPRTRAALREGQKGARVKAYRAIIIAQWAFTALVAARCYAIAVAPSRLGFTMPVGWRLVASILLIVATAALFTWQARVLARVSNDRIGPLRERLAPKIGDAILILPRTPSELRWFALLSLTAGFCEEVLFRGYGIWVLRPWFGLAGAAVMMIILFGAGHAYQGKRGAIRSTMVGAVITAIVLGTRSIIPAMIIHAIIDLGGGATGYALVGEHRNVSSGPRV